MNETISQKGCKKFILSLLFVYSRNKFVCDAKNFVICGAENCVICVVVLPALVSICLTNQKVDMTKGKLWWLVKEEDEIYIHCSDPKSKGSADKSGSPLRQYGSGPHRRISHVVGHVTSVSVARSSTSLQVPRNRTLVEAVLVSLTAVQAQDSPCSPPNFI